MLKLTVEGMGHEVRTALDGLSAISAAVSYRPDVVFLDLGLPIISGLDVARELRRHREIAHMRLVALTGWGQEEDRRHTSEAGFDHPSDEADRPGGVGETPGSVRDGASVESRPRVLTTRRARGL